MRFRNRYEASQLLLKQIEDIKSRNGIVLAIPRGGVPIGFELAKYLHFPLEIILSKKIGHPMYKEFAIGAVSLHGVILDETISGISSQYIQSEVSRIRETLKEKYTLFMQGREQADLKGKTILLVDDGIATGNTMLSVIEMILQNEPEKVIVAVPVASQEAFRLISGKVDGFIAVSIPEDFLSVGQFYDDFTQISDLEVIQLLNKSQAGND